MPLIIDDYEPSAYEKQRIERIKKNEEHMKKLGLHKYQDFMKKKSPPKKENKFPPTPKVKPGEERRSGRFVSKSKSELVMLDYAAEDNEKIMSQDGADYDDNGDDDDEDNISYQTTKPRSKKIRGIDQEEWKLSEKERESLAGSVDENYLGKFQEFLEDHDGISEQNVRNVMRQVRKLASGAGIRYESPSYGWPENCYFKKGVKITPMSDFIQLMQEGKDCENKYGRDHGNGWLIAHPLKKLLIFQQFILNNPSFLNSKTKLKYYFRDSESNDYQVPNAYGVSKNVNKTKQARQKKSILIPKQLDMDAGKDLIGRRIGKDFSGEIYFGTLDKFCPKNEFYHVLYDDGDSEEFLREGIDHLLSHYETIKSSDVSPQKTTPGPRISKCKRENSPRHSASRRSQKKARVSVVTP